MNTDARHSISGFELAQLMTRACCRFKCQQMGMYSEGPFTRVSFGLMRGELVLHYGTTPESAAVTVFTIGNGPDTSRYSNPEITSRYWQAA